MLSKEMPVMNHWCVDSPLNLSARIQQELEVGPVRLRVPAWFKFWGFDMVNLNLGYEARHSREVEINFDYLETLITTCWLPSTS